MKAKRKFATILGIVALAMVFVSTANAACGPQSQLKPQSWNGASGVASLLPINNFLEPIVGMWHVQFIAQGNKGSMAPPDGTVIDSALVVWHADGTEIMNSGRPAQDGNFCMGVWERTGFFRYQLNHFALGNDTENSPSGIGNPAGPTRFQETVVVSPDGNHYSGQFTLDGVNPDGSPAAHIVGILKATRVTVHTTIQGIL